MKYGQALQQRSVPEWAPYNIDYNELKYLIKANTSRDQGQAMTIPGHGDTALQKFENLFLAELWSQHDRVDLFVMSKADEYSRRLRDCQKKTIGLIARIDADERRCISPKRRLRLARLESRILKCGDDMKNLERFVTAQRVGFEKILKKYRKWTGSTALGVRFSDVLTNPKGFTRRDFTPLYHQYDVVLTLLRDATPSQSETTTPVIPAQPNFPSRAQEEDGPPAEQQHYWNEYDDGSEAGQANEPYTICIDPEDESGFPGAQRVVQIFTRLASGAKSPIKTIKTWFIPPSTVDERQPLIPESRGVPQRKHSNAFSATTDADDDVSSSSEFPTGYEAHYATLPSIQEQRLSHNRQQLLLYGTLTCFTASFMLLFIATVLVATGRHRLRAEVDAGAIVGIVASLLFATLGFTMMIYRWAFVGPLYIFSVTTSFSVVCVISGTLFVLVMRNIQR